MAASINEQAQAAVWDYVAWQQEKIGRDINPDQLRRRLIAAGVKRLEIRSPAFRKIPQGSIALLKNGVSAIYGGIEDD